MTRASPQAAHQDRAPGEGLQDCCVGKQELAKTYLALVLLIFNAFVKSDIADNVENVSQFFLATFQNVLNAS